MDAADVAASRKPEQHGRVCGYGQPNGGKILWRQRQQLPYNTAALTTAGGLAFVGSWNGNFSAFDVTKGARLWQVRLPTPAHGYPVTFTVGGRQYIAVTSGPGSSWSDIIMRDMYPKVPRATGGMAVFVFGLPESPASLAGAPTTPGPGQRSGVKQREAN